MTHRVSTGMKSPSMDDTHGGGGGYGGGGMGNFGMMHSVSYKVNVNNESYRLIETLQYHTLLIGLNSIIEIILLSISSQAEISSICLALSVFCDIWCLLLMFRRLWFKKYCNYWLKCTKPCWRCCGINRPELYDKYDPADYELRAQNNNDYNLYSKGKMDNNFDQQILSWQQSDSLTQNEKDKIKEEQNKRSSIWSKLSFSKNKKYKKSNQNLDEEMYQPLNQQYQYTV